MAAQVQRPTAGIQVLLVCLDPLLWGLPSLWADSERTVLSRSLAPRLRLAHLPGLFQLCLQKVKVKLVHHQTSGGGLEEQRAD